MLQRTPGNRPKSLLWLTIQVAAGAEAAEQASQDLKLFPAPLPVEGALDRVGNWHMPALAGSGSPLKTNADPCLPLLMAHIWHSGTADLVLLSLLRSNGRQRHANLDPLSAVSSSDQRSGGLKDLVWRLPSHYLLRPVDDLGLPR